MATAISRLTGAVHCAIAGSAPQQHRLHSMFWAYQLRCFSLFIAVRAMTNDDLCAARKKSFRYIYSLYIALARLEKEEGLLQDAYPSPLDRNPTRAKPRMHRTLPRFFRLTATFRPSDAAECIRRFVRFRESAFPQRRFWFRNRITNRSPPRPLWPAQRREAQKQKTVIPVPLLAEGFHRAAKQCPYLASPSAELCIDPRMFHPHLENTQISALQGSALSMPLATPARLRRLLP